jgi:hypothetical protein
MEPDDLVAAVQNQHCERCTLKCSDVLLYLHQKSCLSLQAPASHVTKDNWASKRFGGVNAALNDMPGKIVCYLQPVHKHAAAGAQLTILAP